MPLIKVVGVSIINTIRFHEQYNTNNYWSNEGREKPSDYHEVGDACFTGNWINQFRKPVVFRLDSEDLAWMKEAQKIGRMTREFSRLHKEELADTLEKYQGKFPEGQWFIRTERVSLKNGQFGTGPYSSLENVIKSLCSSNPGHECFKEDDQYLDLYLVPFLKVDMDKEFRVFVCDGKITAISSQDAYSRNPWLEPMSYEEKVEVAQKILDFYEREIYPKMEEKFSSYTFDLALIGENEDPYFIEPNPFGEDYQAGSALFDWRRDNLVLHDPSCVEFRFTVYEKYEKN